MKIISVGSSSSGNSYIIITKSSTIILDAGLPAKRIIEGLQMIGRSPEDVEAVLITHEHTDQVKSIRAIGRQCPNARFYASRGTVENAANFKHIDKDRLVFVRAYDTISLKNGSCVRADTSDDFGENANSEAQHDDSENAVSSPTGNTASDVEVGVFPLSHDAAEPVSYTISADGQKLAVVTDCGVVTDEIYNEIKDADMLVLEANHDEDLLMYGAYPYPLKMRIKSDYGHLSNRAAGELLAGILRERMEDRTESSDDAPEPFSVMLAHLSFHNNLPFRARSTIEEILENAGFERDSHYTMTIAAKDEITVFSGNHNELENNDSIALGKHGLR